MKSISDSMLFAGIAPADLESLLACLGARPVRYPKEASIFLAGNPAERVGLIRSGMVQVVRDDIFGNRAIMAQLGAGDIFGETFACARVPVLPVSVLAVTDCEILLLDYRRIITTCSSSCVFHTLLIENMMQILAQKNLLLNRKIEALSARSTREKLLAYLSSHATQPGQSFEIPFNRQELADYLAVDRSALSRELSAMQRDGILRYHKNAFELL